MLDIAAKYSLRVIPPELKRSNKVCILFSFSFIWRLRGQAVAPDLKLSILALVTASSSLDVVDPCKDVWVGLADDFLHLGMPSLNVVVGSRLMLIKIVPVYWGKVSIDPGGSEVID